MATYCNEGETARVTFPDGSIRDFYNTPVNITCKQTIGEQCRKVTVNFHYKTLTKNLSQLNPTVRSFNDSARAFGSISVRPTIRGIPGRLGWRIEIDNYGLFSSCLDNQQTSGGRGGCCWNDYVEIIDFEITSAYYDDLSPAPINYLVTVIGSNGENLFSENFDNCNYSVECIEGCSENELDCGDCCLDCEDLLPRVCNLELLFG